MKGSGEGIPHANVGKADSLVLFHSLVIDLGSALFAIVLAIPLAVAWTRIRPPGYRLSMALQVSFLAVPLYVQAAAWSAGFGALGWWRLTTGDAAWSAVFNHLAIVWIHGVGCLPAVACWLAIGLGRIPVAKEQMAFHDGGVWGVMRLAWWPAIWRWAGIGLGYSIAVVNSDMLVTNLFRVTTFTEQTYLDVSLGLTQPWELALASLPAIGCGLLLTLMLKKPLTQGSILREVERVPQLNFLPPWVRRLASGVMGLVCLATVLLPLGNLVLKAGWDVQHQAESMVTRWRWARMQESLIGLTDFLPEFYWSFQLAFWASSISFLLALTLCQVSYRSIRSVLLVSGLAAMLLALPGPVVNLVCKRGLESLPAAWADLALEESLLAPILGLQSRTLPMATLPLLWLWHRWYRRHEFHLQLDSVSEWRRSLMFWSGHWRFLGIAWMLAFSVAIADLATHLLLLPPQVSTLAMRIFDLLHYGIRYRESGLCLVLALLGTGQGLVLLWLLQSQRQVSSQDRS